MSVGYLMLVIMEEIGEILKWYIEQIMVEMIIGVTIRTTVKEISGSRAGIGFKTMITDLTIGVINLEIGVKMTILVERTKEIGVRVIILVGVITAQGAKRRNMEVVELNIRIRDFEKPWLFHVLADLEYLCILGIDLIGGSKMILDYDRKSMTIPNSQINKVVKTVKKKK
ncbi:uncharacterized protein TNCV_2733931 [Trichonephila clavipes]|nr:uncharacterized protein TNCV_2733931 [Trichonephila clavipes]